MRSVRIAAKKGTSWSCRIALGGQNVLLLILIPVVWLSVLIFCLAICVMAARGDSALQGGDNASRSTYRPRRPMTCGTVRSRIFTSVHSDQFATYK